MVALRQEHSRQDNGREKDKNDIFRLQATSLAVLDGLRLWFDPNFDHFIAIPLF